MLDKIHRLYSLIFDRFKFELNDNATLSVSPPPKQIDDQYIISAKKFIADNKSFIISVLKKNVPFMDILRLDVSDELTLLSFAQERLWFVEKYKEGSNAYNIPMVYRLASHTKLNILEKSIRSIVSRHEILRTVIKENDEGNGYQLVLDDIKYPLKINKVAVIDQLQLTQELSKEANYVYDLSTECPIRVSLYELTKQAGRNAQTEYYLSVVIHHIAFDGWSVDIFLKELQEYYNYYLGQSRGLEAKLNLPELSIQYKDFALWQRNYLSGERLDKQLNYWKGRLDGYEALNLITDKLRPAQIDYTGKDISFEIDEATSKSLRELAKELKVSLYSLLLSGYLLMLRAYSNQDDIVIGTPIANRHYNQVENLIGFFVNSLALRTKIDSKISVKEFIQKIGNEVVEAQFHQDLPFEKLVEELKVTRDTSRHPIFQVMFWVQNFGNIEQNDLLQSYTNGTSLYNIAKFDISTLIDDSRAHLRGSFNYAVSLYTEETITRFIETYTEVLRQFAALAQSSQRQTQVKLSDLSYLNLDQHKQLIHIWNQTDKLYPENKTIHELFEEQVVKSPDSIAVVYEDKKLTYHQLNEKANQLAHYLRRTYDIKADTLVTLCLNRNEHMLIAILAVLKVGGAYVPMDPGYPDERIRYIFEDTNTKLVLTNDTYVHKLKSIYETNILAIDEDAVQKELSANPETNLEAETTSRDLAYVIYTSGTTGNPKGVMIEHKGVLNLKYDLTSRYGLSNSDGNEVILQLANYVFDASVEQIILSLLNGYVLVLTPKELWLNKNEFYNYLNLNKVTHLNATPSFLEQYELSEILSLKRLIVGGERLSENCYKKISLTSNQIINVYGPTETTITSIIKFIKDDKLTIGSPISNVKCYVLDANLRPLPIGAIGELYIGGIGLARGYLNRPELTAERFIGNPFQSEEEKLQNKNTRLYKTGDLVRWLADGELEYIGRNDFQIKIRGYRIELGEIERALSSYKGIIQNVVLVKEHINMEGESTGNKYLVGYYVSSIKLNEDSILNHLSSKLPEYMVPTVLVHLDHLPLTINGKLDRQALPNPEFINENDYVVPRSKLEKQICQILAEVLGLAEGKIGIRDDFFKLGGDSIVTIQFVSRLRQRLGLNISVKDIFSYKSIERLYDNVLSNNIQENNKFSFKNEQGILKGEVPLLPIQEWFFGNEFKIPNHWNQSFIIRTPSLDITKLQESIAKLVEHHDGFRLRYKESTSKMHKASNDNYAQYYDDCSKIEGLKTLDTRTLKAKEGNKQFEAELQEILTNWQSEFDLCQGPIYSVGYIYGYMDGSARIYFALHHLIVDVVSWRIIIEDLNNLYNGKNLGLKVSSYRQWVEAVKEYANIHESEKAFWAKTTDDYDNDHKLTNLVVSETTKNFASFSLNKEQTKQLLQESNRAYNTQINDLLLTALGYALSGITNTKVNYIVLEGHGREEIDSKIDITRTVGWFTTMYPVRLEVSDEVGYSLKEIKETLRRIPNRGIGYGALIGYKTNALPKVSFNYLGQLDIEGSSERWHIVGENSGNPMHHANRDYNVININGMVLHDILQFSIVSKLDDSTTTKLAEYFKQRLEEIIIHTVSQTRSYLTLSDLQAGEMG